MKKKFYLVLFLGLFSFNALISCSEEEIPEEPQEKENPFEITVTPVSGKYEIDKPIEFKVTANQKMQAVGIATYEVGSADTLNFKTGVSLDTNNLSKEARIFTGFEYPGEYIVKIKGENKGVDFDEKKLKINVQRGNAVKITGLKLISFYGKEEIWDVQNARSPDLIKTVLVREGLGTTFNKTPHTGIFKWFQPEDKPLGSELYWNLENEALYIAPHLRFGFDLLGMNEDGTGVPLRDMDVQFFANHRLEEYAASKPESVKIVEDNGNLEVIFELEW